MEVRVDVDHDASRASALRPAVGADERIVAGLQVALDRGERLLTGALVFERLAHDRAAAHEVIAGDRRGRGGGGRRRGGDRRRRAVRGQGSAQRDRGGDQDGDENEIHARILHGQRKPVFPVVRRCIGWYPAFTNKITGWQSFAGRSWGIPNAEGPTRRAAARTLVANTWIAIAEFAAKPDRQSAVVAGVEGRIGRVVDSDGILAANLFASRDGLRVVAFIWVEGPDGFADLKEAWDEPEEHAARSDKDETATLTLCRCVSTNGDPTFSARSKDIITFDTFETGSKEAVEAAAGAEYGALGSALLRDESSVETFILTRRARIDRNVRRYQVFRTWESR